MMRIEVIFHSTLVSYSPDGVSRRQALQLAEGSSLADLIRQLGIEAEREKLLLAINGRVAQEAAQLSEGDRVHLMMPISGGRRGRR